MAGGHNRKNLAGLKFGRLSVIKESHVESRRWYWLCVCDCGETKIIQSKYLLCGRVNSCGCLKKEVLSKRVATHRRSNSREYHIWSGMKRRCFNPKCKHYENYGGRGITVCERWLQFENFFADIGPAPEGNYSIDRINNDGNYEPTNCRWGTNKEQSYNKRTNIWVEFNGLKMTITQWAKYLGVNQGNFSRLFRKKKMNEIYSFYKSKYGELPANQWR